MAKAGKFSKVLFAKFENAGTNDEYLDTNELMKNLVEPDSPAILVAEYKLVRVHRATSVVVVRATNREMETGHSSGTE